MKKTISIILTVVMLLGVFSFGNVFAVNPTLTLDVPAQVEITVGGDVRSFDFTPSESGYYAFYSTCSDPSADTKAEQLFMRAAILLSIMTMRAAITINSE